MFHTLLKSFSSSKTHKPPAVTHSQTELVSATLANEGNPTQPYPFAHLLYYTIYLQTNGVYAGDQKL